MPEPSSTSTGQTHCGPPEFLGFGTGPLTLLAVTVVIWIGLLTYSAVTTPIPAVNEPHYFTKAKHYWDPTFAADDFFLQSSNPHAVFYVSTGWLTKYFSLETSAAICRVIGYGTLAAGWALLVTSLTGTAWAALPAISIFLFFAGVQNFSGEWLVGGIEAKIFSYAALFFSLSFWLDRRLCIAALCAGIATSFHPLVGGWGVIAMAVAEVASWLTGAQKPNPRLLILPAILFLVTALPGLIPAVLSQGGLAQAEVVQAAHIQVFNRLRHHLDPMAFPLRAYVAYALMIAVWEAGLFVLFHRSRSGRPTSAASWPIKSADPLLKPKNSLFSQFVLASVALALAGILIGWRMGFANGPMHDLRASLLKFYPFRLADVVVPLAVSVVLVQVLFGWLSRGRAVTSRIILAVLTIPLFLASLSINPDTRNPSRLTAGQRHYWKQTCAWIRQNTRPDSEFVTPTNLWGFKWWAHRAEYVNRKDAPQDAGNLLEWKRRSERIRSWWNESLRISITHERLQQLGEETNSDYLLTYHAKARFADEPIYDDGLFRIYDLQSDKP